MPDEWFRNESTVARDIGGWMLAPGETASLDPQDPAVADLVAAGWLAPTTRPDDAPDAPRTPSSRAVRVPRQRTQSEPPEEQ